MQIEIQVFLVFHNRRPLLLKGPRGTKTVARATAGKDPGVFAKDTLPLPKVRFPGEAKMVPRGTKNGREVY